MTDPTEIARVAAGLTRAQREVIARQQGSHSDVIDPAIYDLWYCITKVGGGQFKISLTRFGLAIYGHILREKSGG